jgi:hypothetical protein
MRYAKAKPGDTCDLCHKAIPIGESCVSVTPNTLGGLRRCLKCQARRDALTNAPKIAQQGGRARKSSSDKHRSGRVIRSTKGL